MANLVCLNTLLTDLKTILINLIFLIYKQLKAKLLFSDAFPQAILRETRNRDIIKIWIETEMIDYTLRKKTGENLFQLAKKNSLLDYIKELLIRED